MEELDNKLDRSVVDSKESLWLVWKAWENINVEIWHTRYSSSKWINTDELTPSAIWCALIKQLHISGTLKSCFGDRRVYLQSNKVGCQCYKNYLQRQNKYLSGEIWGGAYPLLQTVHHHRPNETFGLRKRYTHNNSETKYTSFYSSFPFATSHTLKTWTRERKQSPVAEHALWDTDSPATTHSPPRSPPLSLRTRRSLSARRIQGHAVK